MKNRIKTIIDAHNSKQLHQACINNISACRIPILINKLINKTEDPFMKNIITNMYVYYKRRTLVLLAIISISFILLAIWIAYTMFYGTDFKKTDPKNPVIIFSVFIFFGAVSSLVFIIHCLRHKGPVYIITPEGITDCKRGFISWNRIKKVMIQNSASYTDRCMLIILQDPKEHFGGTLKSFFGIRRLVLNPFLMMYKTTEYR